MAKHVKLDIVFNNSLCIYPAGGAVAGTIHMEALRDMKIRGVKLLVHGFAVVHWDEKRSYTKASSGKVTYNHSECYLDEIVTVFDAGSVSAATKYRWPFQVSLPQFLPATYEGRLGHVHYYARVIVERMWRADIDFTKPFTVLGHLDLNLEPDITLAIRGSGDLQRRQIWCCRPGGEISADLTLPHRGFVRGQSVPFVVNIQNDSRFKVTAKVILYQVVVFRADKRVRKLQSPLKGVCREDVLPTETVNWQGAIHDIPNVLPSRLGGGCKHIDIRYTVTLLAETNGADLEVPVEILIGSIPIRQTTLNRTTTT